MSVDPPRHALPPLTALRAFEAAARRGGMARAAQELSVTPGAVAQQIKILEDWAGAALFERHARGVTLTPLGAQVAAEFSRAFDQIAGAVQSLRVAARPDVVRIATLPSLAQLWLSPRMPRLRRLFQGARISITALEKMPDLLRDGFDLALFLEPLENCKGVPLARDRIFPVCAPAEAVRIRKPSDLGQRIWLKDSTWADDWALWQKGAGVDLKGEPDALWFSLYALALAEAENGAGLLMGHELLCAEALGADRLVAPLAMPVETGFVLSANLRAGEDRQLVKGIVADLAKP